MIPGVFADRARDTKSDEIVALKKVRMDKEKDGKSLIISLTIPTFYNICSDFTNILVSKSLIDFPSLFL